MYKIDVILPVYNQCEFLEKAVNAILKQTFRDFSLIIINDGSTDKIAEVLKKFTDSRIRIYHFEKNRGLPVALNYGHNVGDSFYCTWISADNVSAPTHLEKLYCLIIEEDYDFVQSSWYRYGKKIVDSRKIHEFKQGNLGPSFLYKRTVWKKIKYDESIEGAEDLKFYLEVKRADYKMGFVNEPLVTYLTHSKSLSRRKRSMIKIAVAKVKKDLGL